MSVLAAARHHLGSSLNAGCGRSPSDFVPHLQLSWELEELVNNSSGGSGDGGAKRGRQLQAALHEMWLTWHAGVWDAAPALRASDFYGNSAAAEALQAAPVRLYLVSLGNGLVPCGLLKVCGFGGLVVVVG